MLLMYEKLPLYFCSYRHRVSHRQASCPFRVRDIEVQQQSSVGEDDPDVDGDHHVADAYLNLTADASQSQNQAIIVNSTSPKDVILMGPPVTVANNLAQMNIQPEVLINDNTGINLHSEVNLQAAELQGDENARVEPYIPQFIAPSAQQQQPQENQQVQNEFTEPSSQQQQAQGGQQVRNGRCGSRNRNTGIIIRENV